MPAQDTAPDTAPDRRAFIGAALALPVLAAPGRAAAAKAPIWTPLGSNLAVRGWDPVAYVRLRRPARGEAAFSFDWRGATFRFANAAHRDAFRAQPERWAPRYGGYCAWAVSQGYTAGIDPQAWAVVDGRLYLNYNAEIQARWRADIPGHIARANRNWPGVLG